MKNFSMAIVGATLSALTSASMIPSANAVIITKNSLGSGNRLISTLLPNSTNIFLVQTSGGTETGNPSNTGVPEPSSGLATLAFSTLLGVGWMLKRKQKNTNILR